MPCQVLLTGHGHTLGLHAGKLGGFNHKHTSCIMSSGISLTCGGAGKGEGQDLEIGEGDEDGVLELAPHYQYISGLR